MGFRLRLPAGVTLHDQRGRALVRLGRTDASAARVETDLLTGLPTSAALEEAVEQELDRIRRGGPDGCLAVLDLDDFKRFNDQFGKVAGDGLLRSTAEVLRANLRRADVPARLDEDEFAVLLPDTSVDDGRAALQRVIRAIAGIAGPDLPVSATAGIVAMNTLVEGPVTAPTLLRSALRAMDHAKARRPGDAVVARHDPAQEIDPAQERLDSSPRLDPRTGLATERTFLTDLERLHLGARADGQSYGLLLADIDHFHEYSRTHGLLAGHDTLLRVATAIATAVPQGRAYRYGSEEFAILLPGVHSTDEVDEPGHAVVDAVRALGLEHLGRPMPPSIVTVTAAGSLVDPLLEGPDEAIDRTDRALVDVKTAGRDRFAVTARHAA